MPRGEPEKERRNVNVEEKETRNENNRPKKTNEIMARDRVSACAREHDECVTA